jgi:hypothetical protein
MLGSQVNHALTICSWNVLRGLVAKVVSSNKRDKFIPGPYDCTLQTDWIDSAIR